jgi:CRISPR-associated protein Csm1
MNRDTLFPLPRDSEGIVLQEATQEYALLWEGFKDDLKKLPPGDLRSFFISFLFLYEKWAWCIPAATNVEIVDVSLFEHSKAAAAISVCMYKQLSADGDEGKLLQTEIEKRTGPRYLLVCGDLSGIQQFIYTVKHEHAARALRGRSFALQLLTDAIAQHLLARFDLPPCNLLYAGGGKFWALLPLRADEGLQQFSEEVDRFLLAQYQGRIGFTVGRTELTGEDFVLKRIGGKWAEATHNLIEKRRQRLARSARNNYTAVFAPFGRGAADPCKVCGSELEKNEEDVCRLCRKFEDIGSGLTRAKHIVRWEGADAQARALEAVREGERTVFVLPELSVAYAVLPDLPDRLSAAGSPCVFAINSTDFLADSSDGVARGFWFIGRNRPEDEAGKAQTYEHLAKKSVGVKRLGVLRMDVDSLGSLLEEGFGREEASISRLTAFSKHLTYFFGGYLPHLIIDRMNLGDRVQIVYSGGDDLFLVGGWSDLPRLAKAIRDEFQVFAGGNPVLTLSGGLAIVRQKFPLARAAELAAELEAAAKNYRRKSGREKDAVGIFDPDWPLGWEDLVVVAAIARDLVAWVEPDLPVSWNGLLTSQEVRQSPGRLPRGVLHLLIRIGELYKEHETELRKRTGPQSLADIDMLIHKGRWTWMATYSLSRLVGRTLEAISFVTKLQDALCSHSYREFRGSKPPIEIINIAARWADYLTRKEEV